MANPQEIVMRVHGVEITAEQRGAGLAAMIGRFTSGDIRSALAKAGVPNEGPPRGMWRDSRPIDRCADRLLQLERRAGRIRAINNRNWERVS